MYLYKRTYIRSADHYKQDDRQIVEVKQNGVTSQTINPTRVKYITEEIGYWRKANAIHKWFVDNVQGGVDDCRESYVSIEQLGELLAACREVVSNKNKSKELLPTQSGFFFGNTEYDEWYFNDIEHTIEICENAIRDSETDSWSDFYYSSSW